MRRIQARPSEAAGHHHPRPGDIVSDKKPYTPPVLREMQPEVAILDSNAPLDYVGPEGPELDIAMLKAWDIDVRRRCVIGTCPFCGGTYAAGFKRESDHGPPRNLVRSGHTLPHCEPFAGFLGKGLSFLRAALNAGAEPRYPGGHGA